VVVLRATQVRFELQQGSAAWLVDKLGQGHPELPDRLRLRRVRRRGEVAAGIEVPVCLGNGYPEAV
jgi:hypothetical protein